ncbi:MAG: hypothetical protein HFACDABA_00919 [Anaerolineales bacterium]|nr:hypothetical protein [Anaerolineales bacterium]
MRRIVVFILLLTILFSFQFVRAQAAQALSEVSVAIWPEYDRPSVLVIYRIVVSPQTSLPATMTFRIPAVAGEPSVVAVGQTAASVTDQGIDFSTEVEGDWLKIAIEVTGPAIQLEYYDPSLSKQAGQRQFTYLWPGDYAVQSFRVELQQPYDASQVEIAPPLADVKSAPEDLTYHSGTFGPFAAGDEFSITFRYRKSSDDLSISLVPLDAPELDANTVGRVSLGTYLPWLVGGLGVLLITGGLYFYLRGQPRVRPARRRHTAPNESAEAGVRYCPQCGARARGGDRFCRACGARLRQNDEQE